MKEKEKKCGEVKENVEAENNEGKREKDIGVNRIRIDQEKKRKKAME